MWQAKEKKKRKQEVEKQNAADENKFKDINGPLPGNIEDGEDEELRPRSKRKPGFY